MQSISRGDVWLTDLGLAAKVRPCLVLSIPFDPGERAIITLVPHTTSVRVTRFEVVVPKPFLKTGAFDAQGLVTVAAPRLLRRIGVLLPNEVNAVAAGVRTWLGLSKS